MSKKAKPDVWTLEIIELPQSPFRNERRHKVTRFEGYLKDSDDLGQYFWGHTREEVIAKAEAEKARTIAWRDAMDSTERIEI